MQHFGHTSHFFFVFSLFLDLCRIGCTESRAMGQVQSIEGLNDRKRQNMAWHCTVSNNTEYDNYCEDDPTIGAYTQIDLAGDVSTEVKAQHSLRSFSTPTRFGRCIGRSVSSCESTPQHRFEKDRPSVIHLSESPRNRTLNCGQHTRESYPLYTEEDIVTEETTPRHEPSRLTPDSGLPQDVPRLPPSQARSCPSVRRYPMNLDKTNSSDSGCDSGDDSTVSAGTTPTSLPGAVAAAPNSASKVPLAKAASSVSDAVIYAKWFRSNRVSVRSQAAPGNESPDNAAAPSLLVDGDTVVVVEAFTAQLPDEISVQSRDVLTVMRNQKTWLWVEDWRGEQGFVPTSSCRRQDREQCLPPPRRAFTGTPESPMQSSGMPTPLRIQSSNSTLHRNNSLKAAVDASANSKQALMPEYIEWCKARRLRAQMRRSQSGSEASDYTPMRSRAGSLASENSLMMIPGAAPVMGEMSIMVTNQPERSTATPTESMPIDTTEQERVARQNAIERNRQLSELRRVLSMTARRDEVNEEKELMNMPPLELLLQKKENAGTRGLTTTTPTISGDSLESEIPQRLSVANVIRHTMATKKPDTKATLQSHMQDPRQVSSSTDHYMQPNTGSNFNMPPQQTEQPIVGSLMQFNSLLDMPAAYRLPVPQSTAHGPTRKGAHSPYFSRHQGPSPLASQLARSRPSENRVGAFNHPESQEQNPVPAAIDPQFLLPTTFKQLRQHRERLQQGSGECKATSDNHLPATTMLNEVSPASKSHSDSSVTNESKMVPMDAVPHLQVSRKSSATIIAETSGQPVRLVCRKSFTAHTDWQLSCQRGQWLYSRHKSGEQAAEAGPSPGHFADDNTEGKPKITVEQLTAGKKWIWVRDPYTNTQGLVPATVVTVA